MAVALRCHVAFSSLPSDDPAEGDWTDLSDRLRNVTRGDALVDAFRGREDEAQQPSAGVATVRLDNADRALDPDYEASPYADGLVPLRWLRVEVDIDGVVYPLFRGLVEEWRPHALAPADEYVEVPVVDPSAWLSRADLPELDLPRQPSGDRVHAVLDAVGWPASLRDVEDGVVTVEPVKTDRDSNARDLLEDCADAEGGVLWVAADGCVTFRGRHARLDPHAGEVKVTFGPGPGEYDVRGVAFPRTDQWIVNDGRVEVADGRRLGARDDDSIAKYGRRSAQLLDLPLDASEAEGLPLWDVARYAEPQGRPEPLTIYPRALDGLLADTLALDLGDLVKLRREHPAGGDPVEMTAHVEGIRHEVAAAMWTTTLNLSPWHGEGPWLVLVDDDDEPADKRVALEDGMLAP